MPGSQVINIFGEMKVVQLKEECRAHGLKVSGTKKELTDRLKAHSRKLSKGKTAGEKAAAKAAAEIAAEGLQNTADEKAAEAKAVEDKLVAAGKAAAEKAAAEKNAAEDEAAAACAAAEAAEAKAAEEKLVAAEKAAAEKAAAEKKAAEEKAAAAFAAAEAAEAKAAEEKLVAAEKAAAGKAAAEKKAAKDKAAAAVTAAEAAEAKAAEEKLVAAEKATAEKVTAEKKAAEDKAAAAFAAVERKAADECAATEKAAATNEARSSIRSRSPPSTTVLASLPTASRMRDYPLPSSSLSVKSESNAARSRSPATRKGNSAVEEQSATTPSKFGGIFEKLKAKADAKERGDDVSSCWTPRPSPLRTTRSEAHNWQTPPRAPTASPITTNSVAASFVKPKDEAAEFSRPATATPSTRLLLGSPTASTPQDKRTSLIEGRKRMMEELTERMKLCLERLQDKSLDERRVEKYQELAKSIRRQMDSIGSIAPESSPAVMRSPAFAFSPATWRGGC